MGAEMELLSFLLILALFQLGGGAFPQAHQEGILRPYKSYADATIFHYYVPPEVVLATFEFAAFMDNPKCPRREVFIYVQHGSYPVMRPDNGSFPPDFYVNRTSLQRLKVISNYNTHDASVLPLRNPLPGNYYAAAYLNTWNKQIQQEGLGHTCRYSLGSVALYNTVGEVNTIPLKSKTQLVSSKHFSYYKFYIPSGVVSFTLTIGECRFRTSQRFRDLVEDSSAERNGTGSCIHSAFLKARSIPEYSSKKDFPERLVLQGENFSYFEKLPWTDVYYYLLVTSESRVAYNVTIEVEECPVISLSKSLLQQFVYNLNAAKDEVFHVNMSIANNFNKTATHVSDLVSDFVPSGNFCPCVPTFRLTRIRHAKEFTDTFLLEGRDWFTTTLALTDSNPFAPIVGTSFELLPFIDIGGTLKVSVQLDSLLTNMTTDVVHVDVCIKQGSRPLTYCCNTAKGSCCDGMHLSVSSNSTSLSDTVKIPFPEADVYYMSFEMYCMSEGSRVKCSLPEALISLDIRTMPCVNSQKEGRGACGAYGFCQEVHKGQFFFTSCRCIAGYKGWGCTDDTEAIPKSTLLLTTLFLTLSNIFFVPAIVLALSRRYFVQSLVYFSTMIASCMYHACDQEIYGYCLTRYGVLQFCDFFCSILSFWVTLIALANSPEEYDSVLHVFGAVLIAILVEYNRTGLLVLAVPFVMGISLIIFMWVLRSRRKRKVVCPKFGRILIFIPGLLLVLSGLILFAFVETEENYQFTHSAWHMIIALSLLYLLPKKRSKSLTSSTTTTSELAHVNGESNNSSASPVPVFFITSELDHLVQAERPNSM